MKSFFSLIKASMSEGMNLFRISTKKKTISNKVLLPIFIVICIMSAMYSYADMFYEQLHNINMEYVTLTLFIIVTSIMTLIEGIYKSSNLLFNCKDDDLLLSLPIKRSMVVSIRIIKFYIFELAFNSIFILPVIAHYAIHMNPTITFYIVSLIGLFLFPIIPILISCCIGTIISFLSSKFKGKKILQTILTIVFLIAVIFLSFQINKIITDITSNASSINDFITKIYYPARAYIELITEFNIIKLFEFVLINFALMFITILLIGKIYFKINSKTKAVRLSNSIKKYSIKTSKPIWALIKKEFNRFVNSTVFITNAGFSMVLFILGCIVFAVKFDSIANKIIETIPDYSLEYIKSIVVVILFGFIVFSSFMSSITSSMISLEGKSFNILKSLPIKPYKVIQAKVLSAILMMIPCIIVGDIIAFIRFQFSFLSLVLILIASILFPLLSETIGIMINLKYPKMDARNDTEVVKQSMSSAISVFIGMILSGLTIFILFGLLNINMSNNIIITGLTMLYAIIYFILLIILRKTCHKNFNDIIV